MNNNRLSTRESFLLADIEITGEAPTVCGWFLNCKQAPTHIVNHPFLDWVATCEKCKDLAIA
jgi:hypothetical protein